MKMRNKALLTAALLVVALGATPVQACPFAEDAEKRACSERHEQVKPESCAKKHTDKRAQMRERWEAMSEVDREIAKVRMRVTRDYMNALSQEERTEFKEYLSKSRAKRGELSFDHHQEPKVEKERYCDTQRKHMEKHRDH